MKIHKEEISNILKKWDIAELKTFKKAEKGEVNHNWIVQTIKEKYILRLIAKDRKLSELKFELKYLSY